MTTSPPDILFLLIDCLRADALPRGREVARQPWLARLADEALTFETAVAAATTTTPCVASLLSGLYSFRHGVRSLRGYRLPPDLITLPRLLRDRGYTTHAEVTGPLIPEVGVAAHFDHYAYRRSSEYLDGEWGRTLPSRLAALPSPWFALIHLWELHLPRRVRPGFRHRRFGKTTYRRALAALDPLLASLHAAVGRDVLTVVHGDHGEQLRAPRWQRRAWRLAARVGLSTYPPWPSFPDRDGHGFDVWEPIVRVPLVLHAPGRLAARRIPVPVSQVDVAPTLLELAGGRWPTPTDGRSLASLAAGSGEPPERPHYVEACGVTLDARQWRRGVRWDGWKYVERGSPAVARMLYDLRRDAHERHDVAAREPETTARLARMLAELTAGASDIASAAMSGADDDVVADKLRELGYLE